MALDTYANLQTSILDWLARPADMLVSGAVPDMITLFEEEARDRMATRFSETTTTLTTVSGTATVALPTMFLEARELVLQATPNQVLTYVTPEQMDETWPDSSQTNQPIEFTIVGTNFRFGPIPDSAYSIACDYIQGIPALSVSATTNWLLTNYPSTYLYGSLAEAEAYIGNDERITLWVQRRNAAIERILDRDHKARWGGNALQIRTDTGNP